MALIKWTPFLEPFEEMDKMLEEWPGFGMSRRQAGFTPAVDMYEDKDNVIVETQLAGIDPEKVNISIENDVLTIEGSSEKRTEVDEKDYYRKEVRSGSFHRTVALPASVKSDKANASYQNGILKVTVPKEEKAKPKKVKIEVKK